MIAIALAALLQSAAPSPATLDLEQAYIDWTHCLGAQERLADRETPARRVADAAVQTCEPLQRELVAAHGAWLAASGLSEGQRVRERRGLARFIRQVRANVLRIVLNMRH
jgi:hypothetical protein